MADTPAPDKGISPQTAAPNGAEPEPNPLKTLGWVGLIVAVIFAITAMEAPFYFVDNRSEVELQELETIYGGRPIHPDDVHIGAPWRYFGISVLSYIAAGSAIVGVVSLVSSRVKSRAP